MYGLQRNPDKIIEGDMFICDSSDPSKAQEMVSRALENNANALLLPMSLKSKLEFPTSIPTLFVPDVEEFAQRLSVAFYDAPGRDMMVVGVTGSRGKTTVSWLICGILEAMEQTTGTLNSVGYSLAGELMDADGDLWLAPEDDEADQVESSSPFKITPYHPERYHVPKETLPQGMEVQKVLSGMRDRGASCAVLECPGSGLTDGRHKFIDLGVAVHTNFVPPKLSARRERKGWEEGLGYDEMDEEDKGALEAQLELFDTLMDPTAQAAVLNLDDSVTTMIQERIGSNIPIVTYGIENTEVGNWIVTPSDPSSLLPLSVVPLFFSSGRCCSRDCELFHLGE